MSEIGEIKRLYDPTKGVIPISSDPEVIRRMVRQIWILLSYISTLEQRGEEEFEEWWKKEYRNYNCMASLTNIAFAKETAKKSWFKAHSQQQKKIEKLKEGIRHLPFSAHSEAFSAGLDADGAWECFVEECQEYFKKLLDET